MDAALADDKQHILVVDDDAFVLRVLDDTLKEEFVVSTAESGQAAVTLLEDNEFAVMIADQRMPGMTGVELAAKAREMQPHLVVIMLSAYTDPADMIDAINLGQIFRFLRKPWDVPEFLHAAQQAAERYRLQRDNERLVGELERRLGAVEILQDVMGTVAEASDRHSADVLLDRLGEVVVYDLAALLLVPESGGAATLRLQTRGRASDANVGELRDQMPALLEYSGGEAPDESLIRLSAAVQIDPEAASRQIESQVQVPLRLDNRVVGVLVVQSFEPDAFPPDATRLLDLLANGAAEAVARMRLGAEHQWQWLEQALVALPDGVLLLDAGGKVRVVNAAARRMLEGCGSTSDEWWMAIDIRPSDVLAATELPLRRRVTIQDRLIAVSATRTSGGAGDEPGIVVALRDVTHLEAEDSRRREFVLTLSHEIRTPLTSIIATLDLLLAGAAGKTNDKQTEYLRTADRACESLKVMIDALLDLEKFAHGVVEMQIRKTKIAKLTREMVARNEAAGRERGLKLSFEPAAELPLVSIDAFRFEQVVGNLLGNAVKFAPEDSTVHVTLEASDKVGGWVVLGVHNGGTPMEPEDLAGIFDRFRQAGSTRGAARARGAGLGLAICRSIAEAHGGAMLAESGAKRTSFWLVLPVESSQAHTVSVDSALVWLDCREPDAERLAFAAILVRNGLDVRLLPSGTSEASAARDAVGSGLLIAIGDETSSSPGATINLPVDGPPSVDELGAALRQLSSHPARAIEMQPPPEPAMASVLEALGLRHQTKDEGSQESVVLDCSVDVATAVVNLSVQLDPEARRRAPLRNFLSRLDARRDDQVLGLVRLRHLEAFRAAYGVRREAVLKRELHSRLDAAIKEVEQSSVTWLRFDEGGLLAGPADVIGALMQEIECRFPGLARLHYRKQDRAQGFVRFGNDDVPLVDVESRSLDLSASEAEIVEAIGW